MTSERIQRLAKADEVARNEFGALMDKLVIRVLAIRPRRPPNNWAGLIIDGSPVEGDVFAVALHIELFEVGAEFFQVLVVRQDRQRLRAEEIVVPQSDQS